MNKFIKYIINSLLMFLILIDCDNTPDMKDMLSFEGQKQITKIGMDYNGRAKEKPALTAYNWIKFAFQIYQSFNK